MKKHFFEEEKYNKNKIKKIVKYIIYCIPVLGIIYNLLALTIVGLIFSAISIFITRS